MAVQISDGFRNGVTQSYWTGISGGSASRFQGRTSLFFGSSSGGSGQRLASTVPVDVTNGGTISFFLIFGDGLNGGENVDPGKDVLLEYSVDGGNTWTLLNTYDSEDYTNWSNIKEDVPTDAFSSATQFRWRQLGFSSTPSEIGFDNWALDSISITNDALASVSNISDGFYRSDIKWSEWTDIKGGTATSRSSGFSGNDHLFFGSSSDGGGQRLASTVPVDVTNGGTISFEIIFSDGSNAGENVDQGEDVVLEYSTNGGDTWNLLNTYDSEDYTRWSRVTENLPTNALTSATRFRWRQVGFGTSSSSTGFDNWGLDRVRVTNQALASVDGIQENFSNGIYGSVIDWSNWTDIKGGANIPGGFDGRTSYGYSLFFGSSSDGGGQRLASTVPVDVTNGGTISFEIVFGDGINGGEDADPGKDVALEFSLDEGITWETINTYDTELYTRWTSISETIPTAALGSRTRFQWRQIGFDETTDSATGYDNWGLDTVRITPFTAS